MSFRNYELRINIKNVNSHKQKNDHHQNSSIFLFRCYRVFKINIDILSTVDSFSLVDIALIGGLINTSWLSKGLILLFELVIPLVQLCVKNFLLLWKEPKSLYIEM